MASTGSNHMLLTERKSSHTFGDRSNSRLSNQSRPEQPIAMQYLPRPDQFHTSTENFNPALLLQSMRQSQNQPDSGTHSKNLPQTLKDSTLSDLVSGDHEYSFKQFQELKRAKEMTQRIEQRIEQPKAPKFQSHQDPISSDGINLEASGRSTLAEQIALTQHNIQIMMPTLLKEREDQITKFKNEQMKAIEGQYRDQIELLTQKVELLRNQNRELKQKNEELTEAKEELLFEKDQRAK